MEEDWRLCKGQEAYLKNIKIKKINEYKKHSDDWEHEHCEFCNEKISEYDGDLHGGYATKDETCWICEQCYNDFKDMFNWKLEK